jgi:Tetratricopeptide repeat
MNCPRCAVSVPPESRFCLECGKSLRDGSQCPVLGARPDKGELAMPPAEHRAPSTEHRERSEQTASDDCLMQANLLRMRGRWDEAARQCAEALQREPANASAHSLLGDIYENRGRLEDAIHWYQLALDLNPASVADQAKLARAREVLEARRKAAPGARCPVPSSDEYPTASRLASIPAGHRAPGTGHGSEATISWLRVATVTGVAFCCTILALAIVFSASERREGQLERGSVAARRSRITDSQGHGFSIWPDGTRRFSRRAASGERRAEERGDDPGSTPRELQLLAELRGVPPPPSPDTGPLLRPNAVWLDPRTAAATVRASWLPPAEAAPSSQLPAAGEDGPVPARTREPADPAPLGAPGRSEERATLGARWSAVTLEREAYRLALRLSQLDRSIALIHVHVLVPLTDPTDRRAPELAFIATLESSALTADPDRLTDADVQSLFHDAWWGPPLR